MSATHAEESGGAKDKSGRTIVQLRGVSKVYRRDKQSIPVLDSIDLDIPENSFEALMGPSGSGKTTLLNLIAGIDQPSTGSIIVAGKELKGLSESELASWRAHHIGFIFQQYNLLPTLTAYKNVELPLLLTRLGSSERKERVRTALKVVGLSEVEEHYPRQLSGGQEQRVAIARAIVSDPAILIADEPTGNLDRKSGDEVLNLLSLLNREFRKTIIMVTHDPAAARHAQTIRKLDKGQLISDKAASLS